MTATFYKISDDNRVVYKTLDSTTKIDDYNIVFKDGTDVLNPVIEVTYDPDLLTANYMYIDTLGRYYFITGITTGGQRLFISGHVDVLKTYADEIMSLECFVARQQTGSKANKLLNDPFLPFTTVPDLSVYGHSEINQAGVPSGKYGKLSKKGSWILSVACGTIGGN